MTITEQHKSFMLKCEGYENLMYLDWDPVEVDYWLNEAIRMFTNERFFGWKGKGFEQNQKRVEDLRTLLTDYPISPIVFPTVPGSPEEVAMQHIMKKTNGYYFILPVDYRYVDEEQVVCTYKGNSIVWGITECVGDSYDSMIADPFSGHRLKLGKAKPLRRFIDGVVELITDGKYPILEYRIRAIRNPAVVAYPSVSFPGGVSCDLPELVHNEIVEKAVTLANARIGDVNKYKISLQEETKNSI